MQRLTWLVKLLLQVACFFVLFAFALNNQQDVSVNFFFGTYWRGPLVLLVLAIFAGGVLLGALSMGPRWWRDRRTAVAAGASADVTITAPPTAADQTMGSRSTSPEPAEAHGS